MKRLTQQAVEDIEDFNILERGCYCHVCPPCSVCTHPGNPKAEHETEDIEPIYWQHVENDIVGITWSHEEALNMLGVDTYIPKELFVQRIKEGWNF